MNYIAMSTAHLHNLPKVSAKRTYKTVRPFDAKRNNLRIIIFIIVVFLYAFAIVVITIIDFLVEP